MIDYKKLLELKKRGLSGRAIATSLGCKWDTVQRIVSRCENYWGDLESIPEDLSNADIADERYSAGNSTIICSQAPPEKWPDLFEVKSFGQSIRGRLQEHAHILEMKGPDLRLFKPSSD